MTSAAQHDLAGSSSDPMLAAALEGLYVGRDNKALLVADRGRIISINDLAARLAGLEPGALVGKPLARGLFEGPAEPPITPETARWETQLKLASGDFIPVEVVREPLGSLNPTAMVYAVRDLRERREIAAERQRKDEAIRERDRELSIQSLRFDTAVNNMPQGLAMFDAANRLLVSNPRFAELYGLDSASLRPGLTLQDLSAAIVGRDSPAARPSDPFPLEDEHTGKSRLQRLSSGAVLAVAQRPMPDGGLVVTTEDITDRERVRAQLAEYTARLEASNGELQNFASVASHDLQEPLRKIETFADRILRRSDSGLPADVAAPMERIQDAARRMRRLISDLLDYARSSNDRLNVEPVALGRIVQDVQSDLHVRIEETGARIVAGALPTIDGDPTLLRQLLQNLVSNALKFTRPGVAPVLTVAASPLRRRDGSETVALSVADNGIGFDNANKEKIFQIFQRLHGRSEYEGTGVGLATCRRIAERHGGSIDADGRPGEGATFVVTLPMVQARPSAA